MKISALLTAAALTMTLVASATPTHAAPERDTKTPYFVKAKASKTEGRQGGKVVVTGTVKPGRKGDRVVLEMRYAGSDTWKRTKLTDRLDARRAFRIVDTVSSAKSRSYRILAPGDASHRAGRSAELPVVIWSWRDLATFKAVSRDATGTVDNLAINGTSYPNSLVAQYGTSGRIEFNLSRKCRSIRTQFGMADHSATGATGSAALHTDGNEVAFYSNTFGLGESAYVYGPMTGVFRLAFEWSTPNERGSYPALGEPRVLCRD